MQDFEKLGAFYLGKQVDPASGAPADSLVLYDAKDLTTHAMAVGMTGSGKTGLAVALLEEAAIDGIPAILIDPKGDLANILLQFPGLAAEEFRPWIDEAEAARKGVTPDALAAKTAETWRNGLAQWGQDSDRIRRLKDAAEFVVYTPGTTVGRPLQVLRSLAAPPPALAADPAALRDRIMSAASGLLALLGLNADPVQSRDHILLSNLLDRAWREGRDMDIAALIREIQTPPFATLGVLDLESFYPAKERFGLAMRLNNLLASPGFSAWMAGEPLDIQRLLHAPSGKPRISVLYLAHLSDAERMFFVTLLLGEVIAWMRAQPGTGSLRALLYMDEIFGYFPPSANPPSKLPMLTLLKQARAFGLGVVLSTQNPVDLDYKGLSNCGTWFIGRLQTERDKLRVLEGLEGAAAGAGGGFDRAQTERLLSGLGNRTFLMRNVHEDAPVLFQTRWALSYLRGPLTLPQIATLNGGNQPPAPVAVPPPSATPPPASPPPAVPPDIPVHFLRPAHPGGDILYKPGLAARCKLHFADAKAGLDAWASRTVLTPFLANGRDAAWEETAPCDDPDAQLAPRPEPSAAFAELPAGAATAKSYAAWAKTLEDALYQTSTLDLCSYPDLKMVAAPEESEGDFRVRVAQRLRERRDDDAAKLKAKYAPKLQTLTDQIRRADDRVEREKAQAGQQKMNTILSVGATLLGAFLGGGRRIGTVGRATTAMKNAGRIGKEKADVARASESLEVLQGRLNALQAQFDQEVVELQTPVTPDALTLEKRVIRPRKSDISVGTIGLCWIPWRRSPDGTLEPA